MAAGTAGPSPARRGAYAFGDTAVASRRLDVLASVFGPTSRALLADLPPAPRRLVLDLGCGPGHTTAMLAGAFAGAAVTGLDASETFISEVSVAEPGVAEATTSGPDSSREGRGRCRFAVADVTEVPLPGAPAEVIYARFLLVHLPDPLAAMARWAGQLAPGGLLVLEEPERIDTDDPDFRRYLELASVVVAARGGDLYAGRFLVDGTPPSCEVVLARATPLDVPAGRAATIFALNLSTWRDDPAVTAVAGPGETTELAARLERRTGDGATGVIGWWMRQLVVRREAAP